MVRAPSSYGRLLRRLRPYRGQVALGLFCSAIAASAAAFYAYLIGPLLKAVVTQGAVELGGISLTGEALLWRLPAVVVGVACLKAGAQYLQGGLMQSVGQRVMRGLRQEVYDKLLRLPPRYFATRHSGELLSRFTSDVAQVEFAVAQALTSYVKDSAQVLALLVACFMIDRRLFLLAFIVLPAAMIPVSRFARSVKKVATRTQGSLGALNQLCAEQLHNLPAVAAYRAEARALSRFDAEQDKYLKDISRSLFIRGAFTPTLEVMGIIGVALVVAFGARAVRQEPALTGKLLSFLVAALLMYQPLKALSGTFALVMQGISAAERLFELADEPAPVDHGAVAGPMRTAIRFEDLRASYEDGREILRGISLEVPAGARVALVGASGAGKTTVFAVLLGFLEKSGGEVLYDGVPLETLSRASVRAQLGWVSQEPALFSGTVRENLLLGAPVSGELALWEALRRAHADIFVRALPKGLDEEVGERGSRLSGGQRQRIAIARAFLREPSVLLLDEPTSALDAGSEREVQEGLAELMRGRTTLVIAHRLATVRDADRIYVIEGGWVVEQGTHAELVMRNGHYARLLGEGHVAAA